jgi:hypothetical protein
MQIMPGTGKSPGYGVEPYRGEGDDLRFAADYLKAMMEEHGGDVEKALAAYNAGPGAVQKHGGVPPYPETQSYVSRVLGLLVPEAKASETLSGVRGSTLRLSDVAEAPVGEETSRRGGVLKSVAREVPRIGYEMMGASLGGALGLPLGPLGVAGGAGLGAAAASEAQRLIESLMQGRGETRTFPEQMRDVAVTAGTTAVGGRVGELAEEGIRRALLSGKRVLSSSPYSGAAVSDEFRRLGVTPSPGAVTGAKSTQSLESALATTIPASMPRMQAFHEKIMDEMRAAANRVSSKFGPTLTKEELGVVLQRGAKATTERFKGQQEQLYDRAFDMIGRDTRVPLAEVRALEGQVKAQIAEAPKSLGAVLGPAQDRIGRLVADAGPDGIPFEAFRRVRTALRRDLDDPLLIGMTGSQQAGLGRLYAAMTEDMKAVAAMAGPKAAEALKRADEATQKYMTEVAPTMQKLFDQQVPSQAARYALSGSKEGGKRLAVMRNNMRPEEWDAVAGSTLGLMGRAKPGAQDFTGEVWSPSTFLTNWSQLAPEAKKALFSGPRYARLAPELDRLVLVASRLKDVERMANPSGTARHAAVSQTLGALGIGSAGYAITGDPQSAVLAAASTIVAPRYAARLMTSPGFVRWLVQVPNAVTSAGGIGAHIGRLVGIANVEPEVKEDIGEYIKALEQVR